MLIATDYWLSVLMDNVGSDESSIMAQASFAFFSTQVHYLSSGVREWDPLNAYTMATSFFGEWL